jgi:hypothetical protein
MDDLRGRIDAILVEARDSIRDGCCEQSEYAAGRDAAANDAYEVIDCARAKIAALLTHEKEHTEPELS